MAVSNGFHAVRLSSLAEELDEVDPRVRGQLVKHSRTERPVDEPGGRAGRPRKTPHATGDVVDRGPESPHKAEWQDERRALELEGKRRCSKCRHVKKLEGFSARSAWCRDCANSYARELTRAKAKGSAPASKVVRKIHNARAAAIAHAAPTSKSVLQMIAGLRSIREERDQLKGQVDRLRKERDQAVAELEQLLSDVAAAIR